MDRVEISKKAEKNIKALPSHIKDKCFDFFQDVEKAGYMKAVTYRSYKDEALLGKRKGQRSVRLNRSYRIIYKLKQKEIFILDILEINKHDY